MKIDKKNPKHWIILLISAANVLIALIYRRTNRKIDQRSIVFYGHKFNGNLKSFYDFLAINYKNYKPYFLTMDSRYSRTLPPSISVLKTTSPRDMIRVARANAMLTSHGSHALVFLNKYSDMKFVDVWHGVSYKGWGKDSFGEQKDYDEVWVTSEHIRDIYIRRFGFSNEKVKVTGYGRTDQLVNGSMNKAQIIKRYHISKAKKYILIAPTWKQDDAGRGILPFNTPENIFFEELNNLAKDRNAHIIFRTHLNSSEEIDVSHLANISFMPYGKYEVVEDFLFIADVMVTDWSSVGIDFLPLKRPTIFLDMPAPFKEGFELGPSHRYGDIVGSFPELKNALISNLDEPEKFFERHKKNIIRTTKAAYGKTLDGNSCQRYFENLERLLTH